MKHKKKKKSAFPLSRKTITELLVILESCHNALLSHNNFNLAEAIIQEYVNTIPQEGVDQQLTKSFFHAVQQRDATLLLAVVEAEMERLMTEKVKMMRKTITQS